MTDPDCLEEFTTEDAARIAEQSTSASPDHDRATCVRCAVERQLARDIVAQTDRAMTDSTAEAER